MTFLHLRPRLPVARFYKKLLAGASFLVIPFVLVGVDHASGEPTPSPQPRIINGSKAPISSHPWQVALLDRRLGRSSRQRYFCSGSRIAPDLVITAAHCVINYRQGEVDAIRVLSGRTVLNDGGVGTISSVEQILIARDSEGRPRYRDRSGAASWDVALLKLRGPVIGAVIKLAGASEAGAGRPGARVQASGWGVTSATAPRGAKRLRATGQVVLPDEVCKRENGNLFRPNLMICLGGSMGRSSACFGDSGGPLVSWTSTGRRLVGLTSFGDAACRGNIPSVDTRVSSNPIRGWVGRTAIKVSGVDPIGAGGTPEPKPRWCTVPELRKRSVPSARQALRSRGCRLGRVKVTRKRIGKVRRVLVAYLPAGWLTPLKHRVNVRVSRR